MNVDGSNPAQLIPAQLQQYYGAWSGDGSIIVFSGGYPGQPFEVFTVQANGSNITQRTNCGAELKNCSRRVAGWNRRSERTIAVRPSLAFLTQTRDVETVAEHLAGGCPFRHRASVTMVVSRRPTR